MRDEDQPGELEEEEADLARGVAGPANLVALWAALAAALVGVVAATWAVLAPLTREPPWRGVAAGIDEASALEEESIDHAALRLAGSGSNLPLTRELAEAFVRRNPTQRVIVFESVGSTGGVRAVSDGVVDLGLISRPLRPKEEALGLVVIPYARVAVAAVTNLDVVDEGLSQRELVEVYAGERRRWSNGALITVLQRERGDSSHFAFDRVLPDFAAANDAAYREGRWRVLYHDRAMHEALVSTPGAIGLLDVGATQTQALALRALSIDGVAPTEENMRSGRYPFVKDLAFVSVEQPRGLAAELIEFVRSADGQALIRQSGYIPIGEAEG
ncbi:MAG: substrate-binding domain-containing protein [Myxococcales bacterium]|nr:substrate-binding domain-containing protein [Myxococcales bacterium]MCB9566979.1 substrate-binding domain-containing protein [Myxococcales bacterium]MCB9704715.1 substrate-binding domain-containing protein [Myxococcales bacterium]